MGRFFGLVLTLALAVAGGCGDSDDGGGGSQSNAGTGGGTSTPAEPTSEMVVAADGATLETGDAMIDIPADALPADPEITNEEIDAVVVSTPLDTHYQITMDCLDAGKYVFCEKTLTYTIEEARNIVQKCCDTGLFVQVGHQRRYNPKYNLGMQMAYDTGLLCWF